MREYGEESCRWIWFSDAQEPQRSDPMSMDETLAELNGDSLS